MNIYHRKLLERSVSVLSEQNEKQGIRSYDFKKKEKKKKVTQTIAVKEKRKERSLWIIKFERDK